MKRKHIITFILISVMILSQVIVQARLLPIYSVSTNDKKVSLTFDCAWGADDIDDILATLNQEGVKATFFMVGDWMRSNPEAVKKIAESGHDVANHSDRHPHVTNMSKEDIKKDIRFAHNMIKELTGQDCILYRAPYGEYNDTVVEAATECGYYTIQWDVDSLDWKNYGKQEMIDRVLKHKNLAPGSIVLLHNATKYTKDALPEIIKGLKAKGYEIVPISELIIKDGYTIDHTGRQYKQ
ncbi:polysaccharide deacetylase family protein [Niameybacter massiliensis]|uniref:Polysaccharide deacetylase family protein n=1 Tax=Holtiella tumoricola TaxID=3018743 RepID=A0AA42DWX6_9FIRM|nr:polysaccharide deacetylase family protein [Holtiella tumoricola]